MVLWVWPNGFILGEHFVADDFEINIRDSNSIAKDKTKPSA